MRPTTVPNQSASNIYIVHFLHASFPSVRVRNRALQNHIRAYSTNASLLDPLSRWTTVVPLEHGPLTFNRRDEGAVYEDFTPLELMEKSTLNCRP